ncbi:MAG TPA: protein-glutamine glutaminase family protein [Pyrinomonadaceae bacterium]|jgi:hypothetical protein
MGGTKKSFAPVVDFADASKDISNWAESLRESIGETEIAALRLGDGETYGIRKDDQRFEDWAAFLSHRRGLGQPVYVEADEDTRAVRMLLPPIPRRIESVGGRLAEDGRVPVNVFISPSVHHLNPGHPNFDRMREILERAADSGREVLVTTDPNNGEILHVHEPEGEPLGKDFLLPNRVVTEDEAKLLFRDLTEHFESRFTLPEAQAKTEFQNLVQQKHIPFDYTFDCCTARAHEMCRILRARGVAPRKIWNYGNGWTKTPKAATLIVETPNAAGGFEQWVYHVAPVLSVKRPSGAIITMALDPAIMEGPATTLEWRARQQDELSYWDITDDDIYYRDYFDLDNQFVVRDPEFIETEAMLAAHRASRASRRH